MHICVIRARAPTKADEQIDRRLKVAYDHPNVFLHTFRDSGVLYELMAQEWYLRGSFAETWFIGSDATRAFVFMLQIVTKAQENGLAGRTVVDLTEPKSLARRFVRVAVKTFGLRVTRRSTILP